MDLLLSGGTIVMADTIFDADIGIEDGRVARLGFDLGPARREIDVSDLYLLPGAVDVHTHVDVEFRGLQSVEDFFSGTVAAACGGGLCCKPDVGVSQIRTTTVLSSCFCVGQTVL